MQKTDNTEAKVDNTDAIELLETFSKREVLEICDYVWFEYKEEDNWIETYGKFIESLEKWEYDINFIL